MKIKTKKKMNLPELIKHVWENDIKNKMFESHYGIEARFGGDQSVIMSHFVGRDDTFTVEVEEELTEETEFSRLWSVFYNEDTKAPGTSRHNYLVTIDEVMGDDTYHEKKLLAIYHKDILIWSKDTGIPADGVLEVSE